VNAQKKYILDHHYHWKGVRCGQHRKVSSVFTKTFVSQFSRVIEIGARSGAFSMLLARSGVKVHAYESTKEKFKVKDTPKNLKPVFKDWISAEAEISKLIKSKGRTLVLCSGTRKEKEFRHLAQHLKTDDVIMVHSYGEDAKSYAKRAGALNWLYGQETSFGSVRTTVETEKLQKWEYDRFLAVLWGSFTRG